MAIGKLTLAIPTVVTLVVSAIGAGATYGVTKEEVSDAKRESAEAKERVEELQRQTQKENQDVRERLLKLELDSTYQTKALERLERKLGTDQ